MENMTDVFIKQLEAICELILEARPKRVLIIVDGLEYDIDPGKKITLREREQTVD